MWNSMKSILTTFIGGGYKKNFNIHGVNGKYYFSYYLKFLWSFVVYGTSMEDFFIYRFYEKSITLKRQYMTFRNSIWFIHSLNSKGNRELVEDKTIFIKEFKDYLYRDAMSSTEIKKQDLLKFVQKNGKAIAKPAGGCNGDGIFIIEKDNIEEAYKIIKREKFVVEEVLEQDGILRKLNPRTVNTIRVNALNINGRVTIVNAILRSGQGNTVTDNICAGGVVAEIDIESGIVYTRFYDLSGKCCIAHPLTGVVMLGMKIPVWEDVKSVVIDCALKLKNVGYTSWDIAVIKGNRVAVIEGNTSGNFNIQQVTGSGVKPLYKELLKKNSSANFRK